MGETRLKEARQPTLIEWKAWSGGWLMGIGFGVIVMFIAVDLDEFYQRFQYMLAGGAILAFAMGFLRLRSTPLIPFIFKRPGALKEDTQE